MHQKASPRGIILKSQRSWYSLTITPDLHIYIHYQGCSSLLLALQQWCHNECNGISNHWHLNCLLKFLFKQGSKKTSKLQVTGLYEGNPPVTGGFPSQRASNWKILPFDDVMFPYVCSNSVMSHERHDASKHWHFRCLFTRLFSSIRKEIWMLHIIGTS